MIIWTGSGPLVTLLTMFISAILIGGIDTDNPQTARYFLLSGILMYLIGYWLKNLAFKLHYAWEENDEPKKTIAYRINEFFILFQHDFSVPPSIFWIPIHIWGIILFLIGIEEWIRVGFN